MEDFCYYLKVANVANFDTTVVARQSEVQIINMYVNI